MLSIPLQQGNGLAGAAAPAECALSIAMMIETVGLGGAEMVVLQLAQKLRSQGHTVHPVIPAGREGWLVERLEADGFPAHRYDLRRAVDRGFPARLAAMLEPLGVDVVHSHEFVMAVYGTAAARRLGVPHVITMHGNQTMMDRYRRRLALRWAFRRSDATVAVSEDTRRDLETRLGIRRGLVQVIPNGIPERAGDREGTRAALGVGPAELLILSVGSLTPRKAHSVLLEALTQLDGRAPRLPWRLMIAGDGPERPRLEQQIAEKGLTGRAQLLGSRNDIPDLQAAADVFALPSLWEGLPLAILEAMFGGNVVIASDISGIPEAIENGVNGLLTVPGDAGALANALESVLGDPQKRRSLSAAALQKARARFTIDVMASAYERLYRCGAPVSSLIELAGR